MNCEVNSFSFIEKTNNHKIKILPAPLFPEQPLSLHSFFIVMAQPAINYNNFVA